MYLNQSLRLLVHLLLVAHQVHHLQALILVDDLQVGWFKTQTVTFQILQLVLKLGPDVIQRLEMVLNGENKIEDQTELVDLAMITTEITQPLVRFEVLQWPTTPKLTLGILELLQMVTKNTQLSGENSTLGLMLQVLVHQDGICHLI